MAARSRSLTLPVLKPARLSEAGFNVMGDRQRMTIMGDRQDWERERPANRPAGNSQFLAQS